MAKTKYRRGLISLAEEYWQRVADLQDYVADLPELRMGAGGRRSMTMVIRLALEHGLEVLEARREESEGAA